MESASEIILLFVSFLGGMATIILWLKKEATDMRWQKLLYPLVLCGLTAVATCQVFEIRSLRAARTEAIELIETWPSVDELDYRSKGERIGIILAGMAFLEKHRRSFPETYQLAKAMISVRTGDFEPPDDFSGSMDEYDRLEDVAGAMIQLVQSIAR